MFLLVNALLLLASGSSCLDNRTVLPGQMGQIQDAAVISCNPYQENGVQHVCIVFSNPYQGSLKVFDASDNQFVLAPIAYFPLNILVGQAPSALAVYENQLFVLDPVKKAIFSVSENFSSPAPQTSLPVDTSAEHFVIGIGADQKPYTYLTQGRTISLLPGAITVEMPQDITHLQWGPHQKSLLVVSGDSLYALDLDLHRIQTLPLGSSVRSLSNDGKKLAALALSNQTVVLVALDPLSILATTPTLEANAGAVYLPSSVPGTPNTCCHGSSSWLGILLVDGKLQYWPYTENGFSKNKDEVKIAEATSLSPFVLANPIKLLGVSIANPGNHDLGCSRRLFLVYTGAIFHTCEGNTNIQFLDQIDLS
ncbi:MAG: hypothetical protein I8H72_00555 [Myxococcaceae bacterium]|nr:hypothetical protein [Myxococcaceae bacterium]